MPKVETRIVVNVNAIVNGLAEVNRLAVSVEGIGKFATGASGGLARFDAAMSKSQRQAIELTTELRQLQRELDALNAKIKRDGQFALPGDITRSKALTETIAQRERSLNEQNHLAAVAQIRQRREAIISSHEAESKAAVKAEKIAADDFTQHINDRIAKRKQEAATTLAEQEKIRAHSRSTLASIEGVSKRISLSLLSPLRAIGGFVLGIFQQVVRQVQFMVASFALLAASSPALIFGLLVREGIHFLSVMEQQKIGLAALIQSTNDLFLKGQSNKPLEGIAAYNAATVVADASTKRLSVKIIPLKATLEDLLPIFNQIVTAGAAAGLTLEQTENVFTDFAATAQVINLPLEKLGTGIRLLLNGTARATTVLATALFGNARAANEWVKEHKQLGDLASALHKKLEPFRLALITSESSFAVLAENTKDVFQRLAGIATSGLFERLKGALVALLQSFYDLKNLSVKPEFEDLFEFINSQLTNLGDYLTNLTVRVIGYLKDIAKYVQDNREYVADIVTTVVRVAQELGRIVLEFGYVISDLALAAKGTGTWLDLLKYVLEVIGGIHDGVNVVIGAFQYLAGSIVAGILAPLYVVLDVLGLISQRAEDAANRIDRGRQAAKDFANSGGDKFVSGLSGDNRNRVIGLNSQLEAQDSITIDAGNSESIPLHDIETRLKKFPTSSEAGSGGRGERTLNRLGELRRQTADLLRDIYRTRIDIERNGEERSFDLAQSASDKQLNILSDGLRLRLVSTLDYFKQRSTLEDQAFDRERLHLVNQFKFEERETLLAIAALDEGFDAQASEPKNKDKRVQVELSKQRQLKVDAELNKLEAKRVELNTKILALDQDQTEANRKTALELEAGIETLRKTNEGIQQQLLDAQGRTTAAAVRRIAEQYRDELLSVFKETNPATEALTEVIENIKQLGSVTSTQLVSILDQVGVKFDDLSDETKALIELIKKLEQSAVFQGLQNESQTLLGNLDADRNEIQDRINIGVVNEAKGRHEIALAEQAVRIELERVIDLMDRLPGKTDEQKLALKQLQQQAAQMGREVDDLGNSINETLKGDIASFGDDLVDNFGRAGQSAREFFENLGKDISKVLVQALILRRLFDALGLNKQGVGGPGTAGGVGGVLSGLFGGVPGHAEGGLVDGPSYARDGLLRRLTKNEWVIPAARVRQYGHGLMQDITAGRFQRNSVIVGSLSQSSRAVRQLPPKVVIVMSEADIANASMGKAGQKVFVHHWKTLT